MKRTFIYACILLAAAGCGKQKEYDATGRFEATEIVVSSEATGKILAFDATEGESVKMGQKLGQIDTTQLYLLNRQLTAQLEAQLNSRPDIKKQVSSLKDQIAKAKKEQTRFGKMLADKAVTQKQYDDIEANVKILESQLDAALATLNSNTAIINSNASAIEAKIAQTEDNLQKCNIMSPIGGTILAKYAETGEFAVPGKPLMKIADLNKMYLRAYFTSEQLSGIKLGDKVKVTADYGGESQSDYEGTICWIAEESEFTPKTIQTKDTRANLVYAVKILVNNDGKLKMGLYGGVTLK